MSLPSKTDALTSLFKDNTDNLPVSQGFFDPTDEFVDAVIKDTPERSSLEDIREVQASLAQRTESHDTSVLLRDFVTNRHQQVAKLSKLGPHALLDLIASGMLPARLSKELGVSYATLDLYLEKTCPPEALYKAEALAADMLIDEGRQVLTDTDDRSKTAITKATEIAKNNLMIAKALAPQRYADKKIDTQINQQFNGVVDETTTEKKEGWLRTFDPEIEDLQPLKEIKSARDLSDDALNNIDLTDGEFSLVGDGTRSK